MHVPEGTTEIGDYAFMNCYRMTRVIIPGSVRRIGEYAFDNCYGLKGEAVEFTDGVEYIGDGAFGSVTCQLCSDFYDVGLCRIQLPASVTYIGENAFNNPYGEVDLLAPPGSYAEQWWKENGEAFYE